ncbi:MAG: hypothetical protein K6F05_01485 [Succinivibrio sp.]|nr:hypothetical protein [Succinivibrio sp.]
MAAVKKSCTTVICMLTALAFIFHSPLGLSQESRVKLKINATVCSAILVDNSVTRQLSSMLPLKLTLHELNGNEKYGELEQSLPQESFTPKIIHKGDLLLWGSRTLVLFYKTFESSYSYSKIGRLEDPQCLNALADQHRLTLEIEP